MWLLTCVSAPKVVFETLTTTQRVIISGCESAITKNKIIIQHMNAGVGLRGPVARGRVAIFAVQIIRIGPSGRYEIFRRVQAPPIQAFLSLTRRVSQLVAG
jgi:hypothetical protein